MQSLNYNKTNKRLIITKILYFTNQVIVWREKNREKDHVLHGLKKVLQKEGEKNSLMLII